MSGVTKKIFQRDILDIKSMWNEQLKSIQNILPKDYSESDIVRLLKEYYPHEWDSVEFKYQYYQIKDKHLKKKQKKSRYNMNKPEQLLRSLPKYRQIISNKSVYSKNYSEETANEFREKLSKKRIPKIERVNRKIELAKAKTQKVEPEFLDKMIGMYDKKNTSLKDKVYILNELKKYYNPKIIKFFFKKNDTELNKQLRIMAFKHLQSFNYNPRLRSNKYMVVHAGNKKRKHYLKNIYPNERYDIPKTPHELEYRINNGMEQRIKTFDFFISHS